MRPLEREGGRERERVSSTTWAPSGSELVDVPGVLKAAAVAMRHTEAMQGAAAYDKAKFDRAIAKAVTFCERYAQSFVARPTIVQSPAA